VNGWDPDVLARFRADDLVSGYPGAFDAIGTTEQLEHVATLIPDEWLAASATGSAQACARRVLDQFDAGADGVILHGVTPTEVEPVVDAYRTIRPGGAARRTHRNPGVA
jgi:5,10-methylenetetrahydromethanopterin reductase